MQVGQILLCIDGGGHLQNGDKFVLGSITENGNYRLWDVKPPEPHTSFRPERFEDTGDNIFELWAKEDYFVEDQIN